MKVLKMQEKICEISKKGLQRQKKDVIMLLNAIKTNKNCKNKTNKQIKQR